MSNAMISALRRSAALFTGLLIVVITAGCGGGGGGDAAPTPTPPVVDTTGPTFNSYSASLLDFTGGNVTISADVTDPSSVASVKIHVTAPDSTVVNLDMTYDSTAKKYSAVYADVPANVGTTDIVYKVIVEATDGVGDKASTPSFDVVVPALEMPPPPPSAP